jgi:hypothetical protein
VGDADHLDAVLRTYADSTDGAPLVLGLATRGLLASLAERHDDAARLLADAESGLRALGRHYDAACLATDLASELDASGDVRGAQSTRERASALLEPLGCVNPY